MPVILNIDVTKIPKERIKSDPKWKGKYLSLKLVDRPSDDGKWDGFVSIDLPREQRDAGEKGEIIGNWKHLGGTPANRQGPAKPRPAPQRAPDPVLDPDDPDSIPF